MSSSTGSAALLHPRAVTVAVEADMRRLAVADGREIAAPIGWFPWLAAAPDAERQDVRMFGDGAGLWWDRLDEGISVPWLFGLPEGP